MILMRYKKILLTGGSGRLGRAIIKSGYFPHISAPSHQTLDITRTESIEKFLAQNGFDAIVHCAALARMADCENDPVKAINTNIIGTCNLVKEIMKNKQDIRFIYISTDGVYPGTNGNYSEKDETIPYNKYGWTKLGAECAVNLLSNFCIIRTSFFDPENIRFDCSATDVYSSKVTIDYLTRAIAVMIESEFIGTINIGSERKSDYDRFKEYKQSLQSCLHEDILKDINFKLALDSSLNSSIWKKIERETRQDRKFK